MLQFKILPSSPAERQRLLFEFFLFFFFSVIVLGARVVLINQFGNATPFWDQWDAEAANLYKPYLEGNLSLQEMLAPHNEHRILVSRILALGLLELNGSWDPVLQMMVNSVIYVAVLCFMIILLLRVVGRQYLPILLAFAALLFALPYAWENTLAGFQSPFYFVLFFGSLCLWLLMTSLPLSWKWWCGVLAGILAFLSLASGIFAVAAAACVMFGQYVLGVRRNRLQLLGFAILIAISYLGYSLTPMLEAHVALKAHTFDQFILALGQLLAWPALLAWPTWEGLVWGGILLYLPAMLFVAVIVIKRPPANDKVWFLIALIVWCVGQYISLAYGRAVSPTSSRYLDLTALGLLVNFSVLIYLASVRGGKVRLVAYFSILGWLAVVGTGFVKMYPVLKSQLEAKRSSNNMQELNVREYLCDGDPGHLQNKPILDIPYPRADVLQQRLDDLTIRKILPGNIYVGNAKSPIAADGAPFCSPGNVAKAFSRRSWSKKVADVTASVAGVRVDSWQGRDYFNSQFDGLKIIGSLVTSENDTGFVVLHVRKGDRLLYRTGPRASRQAILVQARGGAFHTDVEVSLDWSLIEFDNHQLPDEFDVVFVDAGTDWGEWSAIALKVDDPN